MKTILLILILFLFSCSKKEPKPEVVDVIAPPSPQKEAQEVVNKIKETLEVEKLTDKEKLQILLQAPQGNRSNSFQEVVSFLDPYGETFAYMNFQDTKDKYTDKAEKLWDFFASNTEVDKKTIKQINQLKAFVHSLGIMDLDAVGLSHYRTEDKLILNKLAIHRQISTSPGIYWHCFGKDERFDCIDFLPQETVFAAGFRVNFEMLIELNKLLAQNGELSEKSPVSDPSERIKLLESLNEVLTGEVSGAFFWDHKGEALSKETLAEFSGALIIKLKENADFKKVTAIDWKKYIDLFEKNSKGENPQFIRKGQYMIITDKLGSKLLSSDKLLKDQKLFQDKLKHVSMEGSMFNYLGPELTDRVYGQLTKEVPPGAAQEALNIFLSKEDMNLHFLNVMSNRPEGFYYSGVSTGGSYQFLMINGMFSFLHHLIFFDDFKSASELNKYVENTDFAEFNDLFSESVKTISSLAPKIKAKRVTQASIQETKKDLEFIRYALDQYQKKNNGFYPSPDGAEGLEKLVKMKLIKKSEYLLSSFDEERTKPTSSSFTDSEVSYLYLGDEMTKEAAGYYYPLLVTKAGLMGKEFLAILANNKIVHFKTGGESLSTMLFTLNKAYKYNERQKAILRKKAKELNN